MNCLLISIDTLRADHLGCYGYPRPTSPCIDAVAADGVVFERFTSQCHWTIPSFASIFTGRYPINNLMASSNLEIPTFSQQLPPDIPTLPELLRRASVETAAVDNLIDFRHHYSCFARGYCDYLNPSRPPALGCAQLRAEQVNAQALPWLETRAREPFFLHLHYWDPHQRYDPPAEDLEAAASAPLPRKTAADGEEYVERAGPAARIGEREQRQIDLYDGEIHRCDRRIGEVIDLLKARGLYEDTLILIVSDHGELMAEERPGFCHHTALEGLLRVPLIVKPPAGRRGPGRVAALAQQIDLAPTVLDYFGVESDAAFDGRSLRPLIEGRSDAHHERLFCFGNWIDDLRCRVVIDERWKFVFNYWGFHEDFPSRYDRFHRERPRRELYDLEADPEELCNLADAEPDRADAMEKQLHEWLARQVGEPANDPFLKKWGKTAPKRRT